MDQGGENRLGSFFLIVQSSIIKERVYVYNVGTKVVHKKT
jgi:hypothetical protein